jgi:hypothetical protein
MSSASNEPAGLAGGTGLPEPAVWSATTGRRPDGKRSPLAAACDSCDASNGAFHEVYPGVVAITPQADDMSCSND